jgi:hypothetical protein
VMNLRWQTTRIFSVPRSRCSAKWRSPLMPMLGFAPLYLWTSLHASYLVWSCIRWFIWTLPDRPRDYTIWSTLEPSWVDSRTWAGVIQVGSATVVALIHAPK